jgi:PAS domain S-box-containing protein
MNLVGVMIVVIRTDGTVAMANSRTLAVLGLDSYEEIKDKNWFDVALPYDVRDRVREVHNQLISGDAVKISIMNSYENPVIRKDKQRRIIQWHNAVIDDDKGNHVYTISSGEDVTERKQLEKDLKLAKDDLECRVLERTKEVAGERDRFKRIFDTAAEGIAVMDLRGNTCEVNDTLVEMLDSSRKSLRKNSLLMYVMPEDALRFRQAMVTAANGKTVHGLRLMMMKPNGDTIIVVVNASPFPTDE